MTGDRATRQQRDLFTRRWRGVAAASPEKEATSLHIPLVGILRWCIRPDVVWRHVPNGEARDPRTASKLKAMGVLPGAADLEFHFVEIDEEAVGDKRKCRRLLHLELKIGSGRQSESQLSYALAVRLLGDEYHVARSINEAIRILGERGLIRSNVEVCGRKW